MSEVTSKNRPVGRNSLRTNAVDQVSSLLTSLVIMIGLAVVLLGVLYITKTFTWPPDTLKLEPEQVAGRGDHAAGFERDLEPPGSEEVEELTEPSLEQTLDSVTTSLSTVSASIESLDAALANQTGTGKGDSRPPGPLGEGDGTIPRYERWELKFTARNLQSYAGQLDFYKIELGAIGGGVATADYASNLSTTPVKRSDSGENEKRLYFMWRQEGPLQQYDRQLLEKAGVSTSKRLVLKFVTDELQETLAQTEMRFAREKRGNEIKVRQIAKTIFESRPKTSGGFEFVVVDQRYQ